MTVTQLKYAVCIAELNSFNAAAKKLFVSQSSISTAIKELESEIGISIFERTNRGIALTTAGSEFIYYANNILLQVNALSDKYSEGGSKKKFYITMHHSTFATKVFADVVNHFGLEDYEYGLFETKTADVIEDVARGKSELGILYLSEYNHRYYMRLFKERGLSFEVLAEYGVSVYLGKNHPLAKREILSLSELEEYPCLLFDQGENSSAYFYEEIVSAYEYKNILRTSDRATCLDLVKRLNGYSVGVGILSDTESMSELHAVPLDTDEKIKVGALYREGSVLSAPAKKYLEEFESYVPANSRGQ